MAQVVAAPIEAPSVDASAERQRLEVALPNLRKLFTWGDLGEAEYTRQKRDLEQELARLWSGKKVSPQEAARLRLRHGRGTTHRRERHRRPAPPA